MDHTAQNIFVGRERDVARVMVFSRKTLSGSGSVAFVSGEAGIGKTMLVKQCLHYLKHEYPDVIIVSGQCTLTSASYYPFQAILEGLVQWPDKQKASVICQAIREVGSEVARVFGLEVPVEDASFEAQRLTRQIDELQKLWELLEQKISRFQKDHILESRSEEKFRIEQRLKDAMTERDRIEQQLREKEKCLNLPTKVVKSDIPKNLEQTQIFGWYTKVIKNIATQFPLVLFLDDLHWADTSSVNLLLHLGRELERERIVIFGTYRQHEIEPNGLLMQVKATLGRYGAQEFLLDVAQNSAQDFAWAQQFVHEYLIAKYGTNFSDEFEALLAKSTEGNALFLTEMLLNMEEKGQIQRRTSIQEEDDSACWQLTDPDVSPNLPYRVEQAIQERVNRLETGLREVLEYASVEGDEFIAQVIAQVRQIQERTLLNDLTRKLMKMYQLIYERGGKSLTNGSRVHEFAFKHNLIREYLYAHLSDTDKELLHADIGECLEQLYEPDNIIIAAKLALHFSKGHVADKAVRYCLLATEDANRRYGASEAIRFGKMGLTALEEQKRMLSETDYVEQKVRLLLELAKAEEFGGDPNEERDHIQAGIDYLKSIPDGSDDTLKELYGCVHFQLGKLYVKRRSESFYAQTHLEKALSFYEKFNAQTTIIEILEQLAVVYGWLPKETNGENAYITKSVALLNKAFHIAQQIGNTELQVKCLSRLARNTNVSNHAYAIEMASKALHLAKIKNLSDYAKMHAYYAMAMIHQGDAGFKTAIEFYTTSLNLCQKIGDIYYEALILHQLGWNSHFYVSTQKQAESFLQQSLSIRKRIGLYQNYSYSVLGKLSLSRGEWKLAQNFYQQAFAHSITPDQYTYQIRFGKMNLLQGNYAEAEEQLTKAIIVQKEFNNSLFSFEIAIFAICYLFLNNEIQGRKFLQQAVQLFERETHLRFKWQGAYSIADAFRMVNDYEAAIDYCQNSLDWFLTNAEDAEDLWLVAEARLVMGKILVDAQDYAAAIPYLDKAKVAFEICEHYALGETLLYLSKAQRGLEYSSESTWLAESALMEFRRLELKHKTREAEMFLRESKK